MSSPCTTTPKAKALPYSPCTSELAAMTPSLPLSK
jgi:hypothetical protein